MTLLEKTQVVPAPTIHGQAEVSPELEGRLRQLEREIAQVGAADPRESRRAAACRMAARTDPRRYGAKPKLRMSHTA